MLSRNSSVGPISNIPPILIIIALVALPFQLVTLLVVGLLLPLNRVGTLNMIDAAGQFLLLEMPLSLCSNRRGLRVLVSLNTVTVIVMTCRLWMIARIIRRKATIVSRDPTGSCSSV